MNEKTTTRLKDKDILKALWNLRHFTVKECIEKIRASKDLQFLLTIGGIWFFVRITVFFLVAIHLFSFIDRLFSMVLG